jgi:hypothetical protein
MRYIDIRVRLPVVKLGLLLEQLPDWAQMIGYDKLEPAEPERHKSNGKMPGKGTAGEKVLAFMRASGRRYRHSEVLAEGVKRKLHPKSVNSSLYSLVRRGLVKKHADGTYGKA